MQLEATLALYVCYSQSVLSFVYSSEFQNSEYMYCSDRIGNLRGNFGYGLIKHFLFRLLSLLNNIHH